MIENIEEHKIETFVQAKARRAHYIAALENGNASERRLSYRLKGCFNSRRCASAACPACVRSRRLKLVRECREMFEKGGEWTRASIIAAGFLVKPGKLHAFDLDRIVSKVRKRIERAEMPLRDAMLIGGVDVSLNVKDNKIIGWQLHFYFLIEAPRDEKLRAAVRKAFPAEPLAERPYRFRTVTNWQKALTYSFKNVFATRSAYVADGSLATRHFSIKPHFLRELLTWLDNFPLDRRILVRKLRKTRRAHANHFPNW